MQRPFSGEHEQSYQVHFVLPQAILGDSGSGLLSAAGRKRHVTVGACSAMEMMPLWCCTLLEKKHEICINLIQTLYVPKILLLFIDSDSETNINLLLGNK